MSHVFACRCCFMSHVSAACCMRQDESVILDFFDASCHMSVLRVSCQMYECAKMNASCRMSLLLVDLRARAACPFRVSCHMNAPR
mmetsp:Transcript_93653/g.136781  ORF Transcript_93653/g.136781 Transcript_93653/m.136781 type:complete len:85 (-) Transcript_93653:122-376(-)